MLRTAIALVALLVAGAAVAQDVGTAAAVNQSARGTPPGGAVRTIALGDNVVHNERVVTDAGGLVQILFVDGTTLMMGPNSELVIDSFFYDPNANSAQVAVTMTKGVLRFIGGLTSKSPDGATIGTPVGTIGIRGGIVDVDLDPNDGSPQYIGMSFGKEVTLTRGLELLGRLYQGGYSLVFGPGGTVSVVKTPPEWSSQIQQALAGRPGTSGGSNNPPDDDDVAGSGVPDANSETALGNPGVPPLTDEEIAQLLAAVAMYDELRQFIVGGMQPDHPTPQPFTLLGASGGGLTIQFVDSEYGPGYPETYGVLTTGSTLADAILTRINFDEAGNSVGGVIDVFAPGYGECGTSCHFTMSLGPDGSSVVFGQGTESEETLVNASVSITGHEGVTLPGGHAKCACEFMKWGFWNAHGEGSAWYGTNIYDLAGAWVAADITTPDQLGALDQAGVTATYSGHAVGYASENGGPQRLAAGSVFLGWSFADRYGELSIDNFDGSHSVEIGMYDDYELGFMYGSNYGAGINAVARGAFANDGSQPAAGVGGDFHWSEYSDGYSWEAGGIFIGEKVPN